MLPGKLHILKSTVKPLLSGPFGTFPSVRLIEVVKIAQCLLTINIQRLRCTTIYCMLLKKLSRVQVHYLSLPTIGKCKNIK